ncbi:hypothetical protein N431DRAFT_232470 [Stipitochalara longipes BDJ]|nr:hypothetical protein N431DRAFT_232470 [Stipitochalara longipes BDJ]
MSTFQVQNYIMPQQTVSYQTQQELLLPERSFKACQACPDWFWGVGGYGSFKYCAQCVVDSFERDWKLRTVLRWTQLYQKWAEDIAESGLESPKKGLLMLEMRVRMVWLKERQEFIRLETLRMAKELDLGHQLGVCMCQGISVWVQLERPPIGLTVHRDSDLGITFSDPAANGDVEGGEEDDMDSEEDLGDDIDSEGDLEDDGVIDDSEGNAEGA